MLVLLHLYGAVVGNLPHATTVKTDGASWQSVLYEATCTSQDIANSIIPVFSDIDCGGATCYTTAMRIQGVRECFVDHKLWGM